MAKIKLGEFEEIKYRLFLDRDGVYLSGIYDHQKLHGGSTSLTYLLDELTEAKIIFDLGRQFSQSKRWQSVWQQAGNLIYQYQQNPNIEISGKGRVWL